MLSLTVARNRWFVALVLGGAWLGAAGAAQAADFEEDYRYAPQRGYYEPRVAPPGPVYGPPPVVERRVEEEACRIVHRRRIDPYGREVVHRVRICDEGVAYREPRWVAREPSYGYEPRYYEPRDYGAPRPPRSVGRGYEDELE